MKAMLAHRSITLPRFGVEGSNPFARSSRHRLKLSPRLAGREKAQLPQGFALQAWWFDAGTLRRIALRMANCLRNLRVGHFTLQAFSPTLSAGWARYGAAKSVSRSAADDLNRNSKSIDPAPSRPTGRTEKHYSLGPASQHINDRKLRLAAGALPQIYCKPYIPRPE
jgi:hypothetical protein